MEDVTKIPIIVLVVVVILGPTLIDITSGEEATTTISPIMVTYGKYLRIAARAGDSDYLKRALEYGIPPDLQDPNGYTALIWAARYGRLAATQVLLDFDANINHQSVAGDTALMWAALEGFGEVTKLLLENGADPDIQESSGMTALMGAAISGSVEVATLLVDSGANVTVTSDSGLTAVTAAIIVDEPEVSSLLSAHVTTDFKDSNNRTLLHYAAAYNDTTTLESFLEKCPSVNDVDVNNKTAVELAQESGNEEIISLINNYETATCKRFLKTYEVDQVVMQNCYVLKCHCTGRWQMTGEHIPNCNRRKPQLVLNQKQIRFG